jgi:hypothetical protein
MKRIKLLGKPANYRRVIIIRMIAIALLYILVLVLIVRIQFGK